jgi:hypothetical protein
VLEREECADSARHRCIGGGYRHQGHVSYGSGTDKPLCNLYPRMLQQFGVETERVGSGDEVITEMG